MIRTELRVWEYEQKKEWKEFINSLSKKDYSLYQTFRGYRGVIVKTDKKIERLNQQIEKLNEDKRGYLKKLTEVNSKIDHLRREFNLSVSVSPWTKGNGKLWYCKGTITRSGYKNLGFNLGNMEKMVRPRLMEYYKTNYPKKKKFDYQDLDTWKGRQDFCEELNKTLSKVKPQIREHIRKNPKMKSLKKSIDFFFPI